MRTPLIRLSSSPPLILVHQRYQLITHLQADDVHRHDVVPAEILLLHRGIPLGRHEFAARRLRLVLLLAAQQPPGARRRHRPQAQESQVRHAGYAAHHQQDAGGDHQRLGIFEQLAEYRCPHVLVGILTGNDDGRGNGEQERGDLGDQTVTDGEQGIDLGRFAEGELVLHHADDEAADDVDEEDHDAGDGIPLHEFGGTVHGAVEVRFLSHVLTALLGLFLVDETGVQVRIDGHLLAGHGVKGEAGAHLGDPARTLGDHHEVDDHQDHEDDDAHGIVAADHHVAERLDHMACRRAAVVAFQQHHPGGGNVEGEPQQGGDQQHSGEGGKFQGAAGIDRHQQHHDGEGDIEGEEDIQHQGRNGEYHHPQRGQYQQRRPYPSAEQPLVLFETAQSRFESHRASQ